jgi:Mce-associated membrane protein
MPADVKETAHGNSHKRTPGSDDVGTVGTKMEAEVNDEPGDADVVESGPPSTGPQAEAEDKSGDADADVADGDSAPEPPSKRRDTERRISVSIRALAVSTLVVALIAATGVMTWLYLGATARFDDQARQGGDITHAEHIAQDYAVNAAIMDYKDLGPWKQNLVKGTTPELSEKLSKAAVAMEQILLPLQWSSTAQPLAAKVRTHQNGVYVVDAFVSVMTKTVQAADNLQSTATYSVTIDSNNAWKISDVGGIASAVGQK